MLYGQYTTEHSFTELPGTNTELDTTYDKLNNTLRFNGTRLGSQYKSRIGPQTYDDDDEIKRVSEVEEENMTREKPQKARRATSSSKRYTSS